MQVGTLLAPVKAGVHQDPLILLCKDTSEPDSPCHILVPGVVPPQRQDLALSLVKLYEVPDSSFLLPVQVPLDVSMTFWCT